MEVVELLPSDQRQFSGQRAAQTLLPAAQSMATVTPGETHKTNVVSLLNIYSTISTNQ